MRPMIDKTLIRTRFARNLESYAAEAAIQREMARNLLDQLHLALGKREFETIAEIGCGTGILTDLLEERFDFAQLHLIDLVPECAQFHRNRANAQFHPGDVETMELPHEVDLILSNAVFQWVDDPAMLLRRLATALKPGGILSFTTFGPENCREIAALTGTGLRYYSSAEWGEFLKPEFELLACSDERYILEFPDPLAVLHHLKSTGVTGVAPTERWNRRKLTEFRHRYREMFSLDNQHVSLTYHPLTLTARRYKS